MKTINRKSLMAGIGLMLGVMLQPLIVFACGVSIVPSGELGKNWTYGNDSAEQSFINYDKGQEKLIISRDFNNGGKNTVWVIPVPASPTSIKTDVLSDTPRLEGYDLRAKAFSNLDDVRDGLLATQIYPAIPMLFSKPPKDVAVSSSARILGGVAKTAAPKPESSSVVVYDHLEKNGMVVEVLSADKSDDLYSYLKSKGLKVEKGAINILQSYIGKDFAFVANWIKPTYNTDPRKGLQMTFPTKKIFYPLKPGSVHPGTGLPETIHVIGYVSPKLYDNIKDGTKVEYARSPDPYPNDGFFESDKAFGFTNITIDTQPKAMTEDLYISSKTPFKISLAQALDSKPFAIVLVIFVAVTLFASSVALLAVSYKSGAESYLIKTGSLSLLGIVGAIISSLFVIKLSRAKRIIYILLYTGIFVITILLIHQVLMDIYRPAT